MEIIKDSETKFNQLGYGDCFFYPSRNDVFMKIIQLKDPSDDTEWNCVELKTGAVYFIEDDDAVIKVDCTLNYKL